MTTRSEEVPHIRSVFRQSDDNGKIKLVERLSDVAREYLPAAVVAKVPQPYFSKQDRAAYKAIGQSLEWNLTILGDTGVYAFSIAARDAGLTQSQQSAAALLYACFEALEANLVSDRVQQSILDAFSGLDSDDVVKGKNAVRNPIIASKFPRGTGKSATPEAVAQFVKDRLNTYKFESVVSDAALNFATSESMITRRISAARKAGLLSYNDAVKR